MEYSDQELKRAVRNWDIGVSTEGTIGPIIQAYGKIKCPDGTYEEIGMVLCQKGLIKGVTVILVFKNVLDKYRIGWTQFVMSESSFRELVFGHLKDACKGHDQAFRALTDLKIGSRSQVATDMWLNRLYVCLIDYFAGLVRSEENVEYAKRLQKRVISW